MPLSKRTLFQLHLQNGEGRRLKAPRAVGQWWDAYGGGCMGPGPLLLEQAKTRCRCDAMLALGIRTNFSCRTLAAWEDLVKVITFLQYRDQLSWNATSVGLHKRSHVELRCPLLTVLFMHRCAQPGTAVSPSSPSALLSIPPQSHTVVFWEDGVISSSVCLCRTSEEKQWQQ